MLIGSSHVEAISVRLTHQEAALDGGRSLMSMLTVYWLVVGERHDSDWLHTR